MIQNSQVYVEGTLRGTGSLQKWKKPHPPPGSNQQHLSSRDRGWWGIMSGCFAGNRTGPSEALSSAIPGFLGSRPLQGPGSPPTDLWPVQSANLYPLWLCFYSIASPRAGFIPQTYKSVRASYIAQEVLPRWAGLGSYL